MFRENFFDHDPYIENDVFRLDDDILLKLWIDTFSSRNMYFSYLSNTAQVERCSGAMERANVDLRSQMKNKTFCSSN